jgi:hypothetical protein
MWFAISSVPQMTVRLSELQNPTPERWMSSQPKFFHRYWRPSDLIFRSRSVVPGSWLEASERIFSILNLF